MGQQWVNIKTISRPEDPEKILSSILGISKSGLGARHDSMLDD